MLTSTWKWKKSTALPCTRIRSNLICTTKS